MNILYYVVIALHIAACLFLISVVLLQQGKGQDLASAFGGGGSQTAFGPRGSATVLSRATAILAGVFMVTSLALSLVRPREASLLDAMPQTVAPAEAGEPAPAGDAEGAGSAAGEGDAAPAGDDGAEGEGGEGGPQG